ncbi:uncharacterized protein N7487_011107 [Penicillium crustosum]|uniref:uncharacterized protein n=1 Tax=Penicillium crustosum TaxID=36656 RepID=UPI00238613D0|nr:uncharacterized protein N7487_011107 [Penicillium crustosum]KAJ5393466.1 hypothetical protein N7487_011107 [Penicillium crustosum]
MSKVVYITTEPSDRTRVKGITQTPDWIHPQLIESTDAIKGRQFRVSGPIPKGACLLVDPPYAVIPVVDEPAHNDNLICSNPACNRPAPCHTRTSCPNACIPDVTWCGSTCRDADSLRHGFECAWLKRYAGTIRSKRSEYDFGMLWVILRLLAARHCQLHDGRDVGVESTGNWKHGWSGIESLCGSEDTWPHDMVRSWSALVKKYLKSSPTLPHEMSADRVLHLICQEEANSFGLYPRETGIFPLPNPPVDRGEQYAAAVYPTAAIANHSCLPNIIHKADDKGRMVFTASRDIFPGEECCISYFDLTQYTDLTSRREHLRKSFRFVCQCERCVSEESAEESTEWTAMPMMDM